MKKISKPKKNISEKQKVNQFSKKSDARRKGNGRPKGCTKAYILGKKLGFIDTKNNTIALPDLKDIKKIEEASKYLISFITPEELAYRIASLAKIGDKDMIKIIAEYYWGKPVQKIAGSDIQDAQPIRIHFLPEKKQEVNNETTQLQVDR